MNLEQLRSQAKLMIGPPAARPPRSGRGTPAERQQSAVGVCAGFTAHEAVPLKGKANGRYRHGNRTKEARAWGSDLARIMRHARDLLRRRLSGRR